jgi:hypothetical protein
LPQLFSVQNRRVSSGQQSAVLDIIRSSQRAFGLISSGDIVFWEKPKNMGGCDVVFQFQSGNIGMACVIFLVKCADAVEVKKREEKDLRNFYTRRRTGTKRDERRSSSLPNRFTHPAYTTPQAPAHTSSYRKYHSASPP